MPAWTVAVCSCVDSLCCCSGKENRCGSPQPPHRNVEVSDPIKPDSTGLIGRASPVLLPRTPASTCPQCRNTHRPGGLGTLALTFQPSCNSRCRRETVAAHLAISGVR
jgi:hypothetical protein